MKDSRNMWFKRFLFIVSCILLGRSHMQAMDRTTIICGLISAGTIGTISIMLKRHMQEMIDVHDSAHAIAIAIAEDRERMLAAHKTLVSKDELGQALAPIWGVGEIKTKAEDLGEKITSLAIQLGHVADAFDKLDFATREELTSELSKIKKELVVRMGLCSMRLEEIDKRLKELGIAMGANSKGLADIEERLIAKAKELES